jgi:hypothetical protein
MPSRDEILRSLTGAWHLFLDRPDALRYFDISIDGFWRSFGAILLVLPSYALVALAERTRVLTDSINGSFDGGAFLANKVISIGVDWVAFQIVFAFVAGPLGLGRTYSTFIIARNWGTVLAVIPYAFIALLYLAGILSPDVADFLSLACWVVVIRYGYLIARRALGAEIGVAVAIIVSDFALSLSILSLFSALIPYGSIGP